MWRLIVLMMALCSAACDREVSRIKLTEWHADSQISCTIRSYDCSGYKLGYDGKMGYHVETCYDYGHQLADVTWEQWRIKYSSGKFRDWNKVVKELPKEACH